MSICEYEKLSSKSLNQRTKNLISDVIQMHSPELVY